MKTPSENYSKTVSKWVSLFYAIRLWRLRWHLWRPSFLCCAKDAAKVFQKWPQS